MNKRSRTGANRLALLLMSFIGVSMPLISHANSNKVFSCKVTKDVKFEVGEPTPSTSSIYKPVGLERIELNFTFNHLNNIGNLVHIALSEGKGERELFNFKAYNEYDFEVRKGNSLSTSPVKFKKYGGNTSFFTLMENELRIIDRSFSPIKLVLAFDGASLDGYVSQSSSSRFVAYSLNCPLPQSEWDDLKRDFSIYIK